MPKIPEEKKMITITFRVPREMDAELDRIAAKRKVPKSQVYRMMFDLGIDCYQDFERVGIVSAVDFIHFVKTSVSERLKQVEKKKQLNLF